MNLTPYLAPDYLLGYRRIQPKGNEISDTLLPIGGGITFLGTPITAPNTISDFDRFATSNQFNGINTGLRLRWQSGFQWFALTGHGKVAFGQTRQTVEIEGVSGASSVATPAQGGILALSSNIGHYERKVFGIIPEGGAQLVFLLSPGCRFSMGYTATYWNSVVRAGGQIDRRVNPTLVPTDINFGSGRGQLPGLHVPIERGLAPAAQLRPRVLLLISLWLSPEAGPRPDLLLSRSATALRGSGAPRQAPFSAC